MKAVLILALVFMVTSQDAPVLETQPFKTNADCICNKTDTVCSCEFVISHKLTMIVRLPSGNVALVQPNNGTLRLRGKGNSNANLSSTLAQQIITADGEGSRLVIAINEQFPGPRIEVYDGQRLQIKVVNTLHTDSVSIHFHGLHQRNTPWMDGVAFITQCPILPGQTFVYEFTAFPPGTLMYHAHIGDQRSHGLYGAVIIRPNKPLAVNDAKEIIITLQDWNHLLDPETAYQRMITEQFDFKTEEVISTTYSVDYAKFSRYEFQSGLVNGKGRYWSTNSTNNGSPLERFFVNKSTTYRIRVIGAMTLYPMRVFIEGQNVTLRGSDAYNLDQKEVQSIIVHPGERYDFFWRTPSVPKSKVLMFVAETIETAESLNYNKYHAAEAVFEFTDIQNMSSPANPNKAEKEPCTASIKCVTFNCPYLYYPVEENRTCLTYNDIINTDPLREFDTIEGKTVNQEYFFNFAFPGPPGNTPGSVNGREFVFPTVSLLTQKNELSTPCDENQCNRDGKCKCTYVVKIPSNKVIQMVLLNLGSGSGWSHPVHLHGHSFYVMKMGLGTYNSTTGKLIADTKDINCTEKYCSSAKWTNSSWAGGNVPHQNNDPPQKDTVVVPTGGYVVIRFKSDNPGMWFLHCHIDLHNTNGMAMVIDEGGAIPATPDGFPVCRNFPSTGGKQSSVSSDSPLTGLYDVGLLLTFHFMYAAVS